MNLKLTLIKLLIYSFPFASLIAQSSTNFSYTITAEVIDNQSNPIALGNVLVLNPKDSSLIKGAVFMDGNVQIATIMTSPLLLKITALGYEDFFQKITNHQAVTTLKLGKLTLANQLLAGVEVVASQTVFEQRGTDLIVNVANTSLKEAGTALDVIQNTPKVFVSRGGQISVIGKGAALVYLNGQQVSSTQILSSIASNDIKKVEIIENPSAKYDAAGNAVINIITKSKTLEGYKIGLLQRAGKGKFYRSYFQANTYYKVDKLMLQASYGIRPWQWGGRNRQTRTNLANTTFSEIDNYFVQKNKRLDHDYNFRSTYHFSSNLSLNLQYTGTAVNGDRAADNLRTALSNEVSDFTIDGKIIGTSDQISNTLNLSLQNSLDTLGSTFQLVGQYATYNLDRNQRNQQLFAKEGLTTPINRKSINQNDIRIYSFQADYKKVMNEKWSLENGLKNAYVTNSSLLQFEGEDEEGKYFEIPEFTNSFEYSENILAAYSQVNWQGKKVQVSAGLRSEWTQTKGTSTNAGEQQNYDRSYFNLFPSITIRQTFNDKLTASIDYGYRINRPLFQDLNPYVLFVDSLVSLKGNPNLVPEYSHSITSNINWQNWNLSLNYIYTKNKINQIFRSQDIGNSEAISFVKENLRHTKLYSATLARSVNFKKYNAYFTVGTFYDDHQVPDTDNLLVNDKWGYYFQINQSIQLPWSLKFAANYSYTSSRVDGVYIDNPISYLNVSLSRKFFDNQLTATLWGNDVFDKFKFTGNSNFNRMYMTYLSELDFHYIRLSLNWTFGKLGTNNFGGKQISKSELNRINRGL